MQGDLPPSAARDGQVFVEVTVGPRGGTTKVLLVENDSIDGLVVGCLVEQLCQWNPPAPPTGQAFELELPFSFKRPE